MLGIGAIFANRSLRQTMANGSYYATLNENGKVASCNLNWAAILVKKSNIRAYYADNFLLVLVANNHFEISDVYFLYFKNQ